MITLAGLVLSDNLRLLGLRAAPIAVNVGRSDAGVAQVLITTLDGGRALDLSGYYTSAQVDQIMSIMRAGLPVQLVHPRGTFRVLVIGCDLADWVEYVEPDPDDFEEGKINLIEV
jgi:hypothetical protein